MRRSKSPRLIRTSERQNKKQAIVFTLGIVILIGILIQFGPLLVNVFGNVVYTLRGGDNNEDTQIVGDSIILPPLLTDVPEATQSSRISFMGTAPSNKGTVEIYVNDELEDEIELADEKFEVKNVRLKKGSNRIKSRLVIGDKTSAFSEELTVQLLTEKPKLEISSPSDGATYTKADKNILVSGTTDPDNEITVNSFRAIVESSGEFTYHLQLNDGENTITIESKNPAGSISTRELKVTYTP